MKSLYPVADVVELWRCHTRVAGLQSTLALQTGQPMLLDSGCSTRQPTDKELFTVDEADSARPLHRRDDSR